MDQRKKNKRPGGDAILTVRLPETEKTAFEQSARIQDLNAGQLLRRLIRKRLAEAQEESDKQAA